MTFEELRGETFWLRADLFQTIEQARRHELKVQRVLFLLELLRQELCEAIESKAQKKLFE